jgi:hypothetical protein
LNSTAVIATTATIPASKLPDCSGTPVYAKTASCTPVDGVNCKKTLLTAAATVIDQGPINTYVVGDQKNNCVAAAQSLSPSAVTVAIAPYITADKVPECGVAAWVTLTGGNTCTQSATCDVTTAPGTPADGSDIVLGTFADGSTACKNHAIVPAGIVANSVKCAQANAKVGTAACTAGETSLGCTWANIPEGRGFTAGEDVANIKTTAECEAWVSSNGLYSEERKPLCFIDSHFRGRFEFRLASG